MADLIVNIITACSDVVLKQRFSGVLFCVVLKETPGLYLDDVIYPWVHNENIVLVYIEQGVADLIRPPGCCESALSALHTRLL